VYGRNTSYDPVLNRIGNLSRSARLRVTCIVLNTIGTVLQGLYCIRPHYSLHCQYSEWFCSYRASPT